MTLITKLRFKLLGYRKYRIDLDPKYGGTYQLFGFNEIQDRWLLLDQVLWSNIDTAKKWAKKYHILMPE